MKKLLQGALLPFAIFTAVIVLIGCDPSMKEHTEQDQTEKSEVRVQNNDSSEADVDSEDSQTTVDSKSNSELKSGNFFYIARDVADMQLKAGDYVMQLQQTQDDLKQALDAKDPTQLQATAKTLQQQLTGFNQTLSKLNLKSEEIDQIRQNIMKANTQALSSSYLNGDVDLSKVDFKKLQQQMNSVQNEMLALAAMVLSPSEQASSRDNDQK